MIASVKMLLIFLTYCSTGFSLTLEEKVGQMLMVHFRGETINDDAKRLIDEAHVGGFIYYNFCNGPLSLLQTKSLSQSLQNYSPYPLLIAVDHEGGRVQHLKQGFTKIPAPHKMLCPYELGCVVGRELALAGINLNLAPVVEPYLKDRSQNNPAAFIAGMQQMGLLTCAKHYPGHGQGSLDSHFGLPEVENIEPFAICNADLVMTAHVLVSNVDPNYCATLSKIWAQKLRSEFDGVIISDSLTMQGVLQNAGDLKKAAQLAINAGIDILLFGGEMLMGKSAIEAMSPADIIAVHRHLVQLVKEGKISEEQIDQAYLRIQKLKTTLKPAVW